MNERDFCYWLKGFFEIENPKELNKEQVKIIREHLELLFNKITISSVWDNNLIENSSKFKTTCNTKKVCADFNNFCSTDSA